MALGLSPIPPASRLVGAPPLRPGSTAPCALDPPLRPLDPRSSRRESAITSTRTLVLLPDPPFTSTRPAITSTETAITSTETSSERSRFVTSRTRSGTWLDVIGDRSDSMELHVHAVRDHVHVARITWTRCPIESRRPPIRPAKGAGPGRRDPGPRRRSSAPRPRGRRPRSPSPGSGRCSSGAALRERRPIVLDASPGPPRILLRVAAGNGQGSGRVSHRSGVASPHSRKDHG